MSGGRTTAHVKLDAGACDTSHARAWLPSRYKQNFPNASKVDLTHTCYAALRGKPRRSGHTSYHSNHIRATSSSRRSMTETDTPSHETNALRWTSPATIYVSVLRRKEGGRCPQPLSDQPCSSPYTSECLICSTLIECACISLSLSSLKHCLYLRYFAEAYPCFATPVFYSQIKIKIYYVVCLKRIQHARGMQTRKCAHMKI